MTTTRTFTLTAQVTISADLLATLGVTAVEKRISDCLEFTGDFDGIDVGPVDLIDRNPGINHEPIVTTETIQAPTFAAAKAMLPQQPEGLAPGTKWKITMIRTGLVSREHNVYGTTPVEYVTYTDEAAAVVYHLTDATGQPVAAGEHTDPEGYRFRIAAAADITDRREDDGTPTHVGITWIHADNESSGWTRPGHLGAGWAWTPEHR